MCGSPGPDPDNAVRPYRPEAVLRSVSALPLLARPGRTRGDRRPGAAMRPHAPITSLSAISNEGSRIAARPRTGWSISDVRDEAPDPPTDASAVQPWEPAHGRSRRRRRRGAERAHPKVRERAPEPTTHASAVQRVGSGASAVPAHPPRKLDTTPTIGEVPSSEDGAQAPAPGANSQWPLLTPPVRRRGVPRRRGRSRSSAATGAGRSGSGGPAGSPPRTTCAAR